MPSNDLSAATRLELENLVTDVIDEFAVRGTLPCESCGNEFCICNSCDCGPCVAMRRTIGVRIDAAFQKGLLQGETQIREIQDELAKYLSAENENVKQGYVVAMVRDLAQVKITAIDNCRDMQALIGPLVVEMHAAAAGAPNGGSLKPMLQRWRDTLAMLLLDDPAAALRLSPTKGDDT